MGAMYLPGESDTIDWDLCEDYYRNQMETGMETVAARLSIFATNQWLPSFGVTIEVIPITSDIILENGTDHVSCSTICSAPNL